MNTTWLVVGAIALVVLFAIVLYNRLVAGRNQVEAAWRQIDVQLKRRHDLVPNLVESVKGYMGHEQDTLTAVIKARNAAVAAAQGPREGQIQAETALAGVLGRLFALAESYPQLKANENVMQLQEELTSTENRIGFARQHYNDSVMAQNTRVESFPAMLVAGPLSFAKHPYFEAEEQAREAPKVKLR
ncbi:MAG: LemA family protein [Rhodospirillales bacterium]